jgi:hypothetical protein
MNWTKIEFGIIKGLFPFEIPSGDVDTLVIFVIYSFEKHNNILINLTGQLIKKILSVEQHCFFFTVYSWVLKSSFYSWPLS